jgi:transposase
MTSNQKEVSFQEQCKLFGGFDWAKEDHDIVVVNGTGTIMVDLSFPDTAEGWALLREKLVAQVGQDLSHVAVAVETRHGPAVERLLQLGCRVYPINPKSAQRFRERKAANGSKTDFLDAWSMADALRTDGHGWRCLEPDDPMTQELRLVTRDQVHLIEQRTALANQLQEALHEYYPAALEAFDEWTTPGPWAFVIAFPTPSACVRAGKRRWEKFLHANRLYRPETYPKRLEIFARADCFAGPPAVTNAKSRLAVALAKQLHVLQRQLQEYAEAIAKLFAEHPDHDVFGSLPGAGSKLAPRLLSEFGQNRQRFPDADSIRCYAGTAPVIVQSGQNRWVKFRRGCNKHLRAAVHHWADLSRAKCVWADTYYQHKRQQGMTHARALRCLGHRWLKILWKMWVTRTPYNEAYHTRNQVRHGSWVVAIT